MNAEDNNPTLQELISKGTNNNKNPVFEKVQDEITKASQSKQTKDDASLVIESLEIEGSAAEPEEDSCEVVVNDCVSSSAQNSESKLVADDSSELRQPLLYVFSFEVARIKFELVRF